MKALLTEDESEVVSFFEEEGVWNQIKFFLDALTADQQIQVLHGGSESVDLKSSSPSAAESYHQYYQQFGPRTGSEENSPVVLPEPDQVIFHLVPPNRAEDRLAASIGMDTPSQNQRSGGDLGTGFLDFGVKEAIRRAWFLPGDLQTDPAEKLLVKESGDTDSIKLQKVLNAKMAAMISEHPHPGMSDEVRIALASHRQGLRRRT